MGPACPHDQLTGNLVTALQRRPGPQNHWSEAWIELQLGLAMSAAGKDQEARVLLERSVLAGGEYDHPMTSTALLELGRIALAASDFNAAANYFAEASYAASAYYDPAIVEEALRWGYVTHLMANRPGMYPPLQLAATWARAAGLRQMQASMLVLAAENSCILGQAPAAAGLLTRRSTFGRRAMQTGKLGARLNFVAALAAYQQGNATLGDQALAQAMAFEKTGSLWMFQIALAELVLHARDRPAARGHGPVQRAAARSDADRLGDGPVGSVGVMTIPHSASFDHWFDVAIDRKDHDRVLEIADLGRRHRFLTTLDLGGACIICGGCWKAPRRCSTIKHGSSGRTFSRGYPKFAQLQQQAAQLRAELKKAPLVAADPQAAKDQQDKLARLSQASAAQEVVLREIAVRREPSSIVFPPARATKDLKARRSSPARRS